MTLRQTMLGGGLLCLVLVATVATASGQTGAETFQGTATVKTAAGAEAGAPIAVVVDRIMPQSEADPLVAAFKTGGVAALKKALVGVAPTGSIRLGAGQAVPTRITIARSTGDGRLLTIVSDTPVLFLGANQPNAKPRAGYDFAVLDLILDAKGTGSGTLAPAAKIKLNQDAFVVEDYAAELVRVTGVAKVK